jgi:hypothetical protein
MSEFLFPMGWQALNFQLWQSDHNKHLPARDQELPIAWSINAESAPKSAPLETLKLAMNQKLVPKLSRLSIVDFGSDDYQAVAKIEHLAKGPAEFFCKQRTICLNEPEISDIVDHAARVCVEKHHLHFGL